VAVSTASLAAALARVPGPRRAASVVYPLLVILAMAVAAILANHLSSGKRSAFPTGTRRANRHYSGCFASSMVTPSPRG
jgi:hypothetical protein